MANLIRQPLTQMIMKAPFIRNVGLAILIVASALPASADVSIGNAPPDKTTGTAVEKQVQLIEILKSDSKPQEKAVACKRLAVYGTKDTVPALAPLLSNEELASWARIALEAIPGSAPDVALRDAAQKLNGRLLVGVINSIGVRRDADAIGILGSKLKDADAEVPPPPRSRWATSETPKPQKSLPITFPRLRPAFGPPSRKVAFCAAK